LQLKIKSRNLFWFNWNI